MMKIAVAFVAISVAALVLAQRETSVEGQLEVHIYVNILVLYTHIYVQGSSQSDEEEPSPNCSTGGARGDVGRRPRPGGDVYVYNLSKFCFVFSQRLAEFEKKIFALVTDTVCSGNKSRIFFV